MEFFSRTISGLNPLRNFTSLRNVFIPVKRTNDNETKKISIFDLVNIYQTGTAINELDVTAEAYQLEPSEPPAVEVTKTDNNLNFIFGIPKGEQGEKGEKGDSAELSLSIILDLLGLTEDDLEKLRDLLNKQPCAGFEIIYVKPDEFSVSSRFVIPLSMFDGWTSDKAVFFTNQKMYFENPSLIEMWACQPRDGVRTEWDENTATKVPFDGLDSPLTGGNCIKEWGLYEDGQSIWIRFSTAGYPIPIKIIKKT